MRLIDADELNKDFDLYDRDFCGFCGNEFAAGFEAARELIADAPTIDAEPVRHGRWILNKHYGDYECSECGVDDANGFTVIDFRQHRMNYCPNCGAKMRGDTDETE